jgi:hypothetical protein
MKKRYVQYTLTGEHSEADVHRELGNIAGNILRIHIEEGKTRVYVEEIGTRAKGEKAPKGGVEVKLDDILNIASRRR